MIKHYSAEPFVALCGANEKNQTTTHNPRGVNCGECLRLMPHELWKKVPEWDGMAPCGKHGADYRGQSCGVLGCESPASKETNPKDAVGTKKAPMISVIPQPVIAEVGVALLEGARKYGRHNYRAAGVRASVYVDAAGRHLAQFWEGEDLDPDSQLSHVTKAIAGLIVLRDSMLRGNWIDDRPPRCVPSWITEANKAAANVVEKYPDAKPAHTHLEPEGES